MVETTGQGESGSQDSQAGFLHPQVIGQPHSKDPPTSSTCIRRPTPPEATRQGTPNQFRMSKAWKSLRTEGPSQRLEEAEKTRAVRSRPTEGAQAVEDSKSIRSIALYDKIPYYTTAAGAHAAALAIKAQAEDDIGVKPLQG